MGLGGPCLELVGRSPKAWQATLEPPSLLFEPRDPARNRSDREHKVAGSVFSLRRREELPRVAIAKPPKLGGKVRSRFAKPSAPRSRLPRPFHRLSACDCHGLPQA